MGWPGSLVTMAAESALFEHLFFLTASTGHWVGRGLGEGQCAYPSMLRQHLLYFYQENSTWFLPVSSRVSLFLLLEGLFLIFDSNLLTCQLFLVLLVMENTLFPSPLLQPFIHWKTVIMSPLSLLFRANNPTVFNLSSQVMVFRPLIVLPLLLWTLSNWAMPLEKRGACRRAQCPGWGLPGTQQSAGFAFWVLQTLLLFKHRGVAFAFLSAARHCRRAFSLWSAAPDPLVSVLPSWQLLPPCCSCRLMHRVDGANTYSISPCPQIHLMSILRFSCFPRSPCVEGALDIKWMGRGLCYNYKHRITGQVHSSRHWYRGLGLGCEMLDLTVIDGSSFEYWKCLSLQENKRELPVICLMILGDSLEWCVFHTWYFFLFRGKAYTLGLFGLETTFCVMWRGLPLAGAGLWLDNTGDMKKDNWLELLLLLLGL